MKKVIEGEGRQFV